MYKIRSDPVQIPFLYHCRILKIMNLFIKELDSVSTSLKNRLQAMFSMDYLFELMTDIDIYSNSGIKASLNFLVKKEVTKMCTSFLDKNDTFNKLYENEKLQNLLIFINSTFIERPERK